MNLLRHSFFQVAAALALLLVPSMRAADVARMAGAAAVDITPDYPVRLSGYGGRQNESEGIDQHLFAKALAIGSDKEGPAILLTVENVAVPAYVRDEVVSRHLHGAVQPAA